jgi:hypothetical protein
MVGQTNDIFIGRNVDDGYIYPMATEIVKVTITPKP